MTNETSICLTTLTAPLQFRIFRHCGDGCEQEAVPRESEPFAFFPVVEDPDSGMGQVALRMCGSCRFSCTCGSSTRQYAVALCCLPVGSQRAESKPTQRCILAFCF